MAQKRKSAVNKTECVDFENGSFSEELIIMESEINTLNAKLNKNNTDSDDCIVILDEKIESKTTNKRQRGGNKKSNNIVPTSMIQQPSTNNLMNVVSNQSQNGNQNSRDLNKTKPTKNISKNNTNVNTLMLKNATSSVIQLPFNDRPLKNKTENTVIYENKSTVLSNSESTSTPAQEASKYTIKFKSGSFEKSFYLNDNDPVEKIYTDLFGNDLEKKLLYEDMKLSRFLLAGEAGFFPGINYIYLPNGEDFYEFGKFAIIKFNENIEDDMRINIEPSTTVKGILSAIRTNKNTDDYVLIFNGKILDESLKLDFVLENDVILDAIDKKVIGI